MKTEIKRGRKRTGYLLKRGKHFYAVWTVNGKKFMQTTRKTDREEAESELHRIMEPFVAGDKVSVLQNIQGRLTDAKVDLARLEDERKIPLQIKDTFLAYEQDTGRPQCGPVTLRVYSQTFRAFQTWLSTTYPDITALRDITLDIADKYASHLQKRGLAAGTFNGHVGFLKLLANVLEDKSGLAENPWRKINRHTNIKQGRRELTIEELQRVCNTSTGDLRVLLAIGIYTGLRLGDCTSLRWCEVDLVRRIITRIPNKTSRRSDKPVILPIHPSLLTLLSGIPHTPKDEYVLPECEKNYREHTASFSRNLIQAHFKKCGIRTQRTNKTGRCRVSCEVGFHSLRHSFVSLCRASNVPLSVVESLVGHSNPQMTRSYTHVGELAACNAVNLLPDVMGNATPMLPPVDPVLLLKNKMRELADNMTSENWAQVKEELLTLSKPD